MEKIQSIMAYFIIKIQFPFRMTTSKDYRMIVILYIRGKLLPVQIVSCGTAPITPAIHTRLATALGIPVASAVFTGYGFDTNEPCTDATRNTAHPSHLSYRVEIPGLCMWAINNDDEFPPDSELLQNSWTWNINAYDIQEEASEQFESMHVRNFNEAAIPHGEHLN